MLALSAVVRRLDARRVLRAASRSLCAFVLAMLAASSLTHAADPAASFGQAAPLPALDAFRASLDVDAQGDLRVSWTIEPGYYLYRDKLEHTLQAPEGLTLGAIEHAPAQIVSDDYFGEQAVYRESALTRIALQGTPVPGATARLDVRFQGCADIGLCYPPTDTTLEVALPGDTSGSTLSALFGTAPGSGQEELLRVHEAFVPIVQETTTERASVSWVIEPGYYLYRDKMRIELVHADGEVVAPLAWLARPDGTLQQDAFFGETAVWRDSADVQVAFGDRGPAADAEASLRLHYQGCADIGVCFPPEVVELPFVATAAGPSALAAGTPSTPPAAAAAGTPASEQDRLSSMLAHSSLWLSAGTFFGLGLLLAFTPCVLPMVPILSSLIVGQRGADGAGVGKARAFRLSAVYVLVMASTYAAAGVLVARSGQNVQVWFQNPILLSAFAALFVVFALAMFGLFELQLPRVLQSRLTEVSNAQRGGGYRGVIIMGFLSTLIVGPCVTAPLVGALLFIADTGNTLVGGVALFALGLGMGTPLLLVGTSAGTLLPRAGVWMVKVKQGFGILMLGMAIWMLSRFLAPEAIAVMAGVLALASGIWLGATDRLDAHSGGWPRLAKGAGLAVSLYGAALLVGALAGGSSLLSPLAVFGGSGSGEADAELHFQRVADVTELDRVVAQASAAGKPVMLDFYADWCISCKEMEAFTFTDTRVQRLLDDVVTVQVDVTANDADDKRLLERFRLFAPPAIVFFDRAGNELPAARVVGFLNADRFADHVERVLSPTLAAVD